MNGLGLLITIGFCTIIWWGTRSYYLTLLRAERKNTQRLIVELNKQN